MMSEFNNFAIDPLGLNLKNRKTTTQVDKTKTSSKQTSNVRVLQLTPGGNGVVKQYMDNRKYDNCVIINNTNIQNNLSKSWRAPQSGTSSEELRSASRRPTHYTNGFSTFHLPNTSTLRTGQTQTATLSQHTSSRNQTLLSIGRQSTLSKTHTTSTTDYTTRGYESTRQTTSTNTSTVRTVSFVSNDTTRAVRGTTSTAKTYRRR